MTTSPWFDLLAAAIDPPRRQQGWHGGPTPMEAVAGVTARQAARTPPGLANSIWALTLHMAYWKYAVRRRILDGKRGQFPRSPANWPAVPTPATESAWGTDRALLAKEHELLLDVIRDLTPADLDRPTRGRRRWTVGELVVGIAQHDAWHTGQVVQIRRMLRTK